jgi:ABC-type Fe3+/spermidine/putrescine transport system ATPase subunit
MIRVEGLTKTFKASKETVAAVAGITFEVAAGEMVTLLGPSGCGKTTTLRCVAGLEKADGGRISIGDRAVVDAEAKVFVPPQQRNIGMVFQSYAIWPHMTVLENVAYALEGKRFSKAERRRLAMEALSAVKLADLADRPAPRLSGGQQQRVAIARALVTEPTVLLADEPTGNLDSRTSIEVMALFQALNDQGITVILVTHEHDVAQYAKRVIEMRDGRILRDHPVTDRHIAADDLVALDATTPMEEAA